MKAVHFDGKKLRLQEVPVPQISANEALIRVLYAGICNTDIEILKGYMEFKGILGHEFVGVVEKAPLSDWVGKVVVGEINLGCGGCAFCRMGLRTHCENRSVLGILNKDGTMAEYCTLPIYNLHVLPPAIPEIEGVFVEPLAAACEILEQLELLPEYRVMILGDGKLAQLIAQVLKLRTENLLVVGKSEYKLDVLQKRGIRAVLLEELEAKARTFHVVVEATGNREGWDIAMKFVRPKGFLVLKSTYAGTHEFRLAPLVINEITVIGSRCGPFPRAISLLEHNEVNVEPLISGIYGIEDFEQAFQKSQEKDALKILVQPTSAR